MSSSAIPRIAINSNDSSGTLEIPPIDDSIRPLLSANDYDDEDFTPEDDKPIDKMPAPVMEDEFIPDPRAEKSLGNKDINTWLSVIYVINQIYGPGVLAIPIVFQQAGWFPTLVSLTFFCVVSSLASTMLSEAIALVPKNQHFIHRIEYTTVIKYYYGRIWHAIFQLFINITLQSYNIASIIITAQALDGFFVYLFHKTYAIVFYPHFSATAFEDINVLYGSDVYTVSLGYVVAAVLVIPQGFFNLDSNVKVVQTVSFAFLVALFAEFVGYFIWQRPVFSGRVPPFGKNYTQLASVFIFSWAYPMFIPSWLNEKKPSVSVNRVVWVSSIASLMGYFFIGGLCALSNVDISTDNMLGFLQTQTASTVTRVAAYLFSFGVISPGIPVCSITTRYNLYVGRLCGRKQSYFWGAIAPWIVGVLFCQGAMFANMLNWTSLIFNGIVNFVIPMILYITAVRKRGASYSVVHPLPKWLQRHASPFSIGLAVVTTIAIVVQIIVIMVEQIAYDVNILGQ